MNKNYWKWRSDINRILGELVGMAHGMTYDITDMKRREEIQRRVKELDKWAENLMTESHDDTETS